MAGTVGFSKAEFTIKLLSAYEGHAALWNIASPLYKNRDAKISSWRSIQAIMFETFNINLTVDELEKRITCERSHFVRERKKLKDSIKSGAGADDVYKPQGDFYTHLQFLIPVIRMRKSKSNLGASTSQEPEPEVASNPVDETTVETLEGPPPPPLEGPPPPPPANPVPVPERELVLAPLRQKPISPAPGSASKRARSSPDKLADIVELLEGNKKRREERRVAQQEAEKELKVLDAPNELWARNLAINITQIKDERAMRILKVQIDQLVATAQMTDLLTESGEL